MGFFFFSYWLYGLGLLGSKFAFNNASDIISRYFFLNIQLDQVGSNDTNDAYECI